MYYIKPLITGCHCCAQQLCPNTSSVAFSVASTNSKKKKKFVRTCHKVIIQDISFLCCCFFPLPVNYNLGHRCSRRRSPVRRSLQQTDPASGDRREKGNRGETGPTRRTLCDATFHNWSPRRCESKSTRAEWLPQYNPTPPLREEPHRHTFVTIN